MDNTQNTFVALSLIALALVSAPLAAQDSGEANEVTADTTTEATAEAVAPDGIAPEAMAPEAHDLEEPTEEQVAPTDAEPDSPGEAADDFTDRNLTLGLSAGIYLPNLINDLGPHVTVGVEVGYLLPFFDKRLAVVFGTGWAPPTTDGVEPDTRLATPEYSYETTTQQWHFSLGPILRILPPGTMFVPYVGFLARLYLLRAEVSGRSGDNAFGTNTEQSTEIGFVALLGGEIRLGPGALQIQFDFGWSDWPHTVTGDTSTGALAGSIGYRLFL